MSSRRGMQAQDGSTAETQAALRAQRVARWLEVPLIVAALLTIPIIIVQESNFGRSWEALAEVLDWCIWGMFVANVVIMLAVVPNRRHWLTNNPIDVLIVVLTPPFLPATLKLARMLPLVRLIWLMVMTRRLSKVFSLQGLRYAALIVFTVVVGGGVVFVAVEPGQNLSAWDGLWWATETVTTVAYGDIYPTTSLGRIVAAVVMTTGIGFVALLTGALAQSFLQGESEEANPQPVADKARMERKIDELSLQISKLQKALEEQSR